MNRIWAVRALDVGMLLIVSLLATTGCSKTPLPLQGATATRLQPVVTDGHLVPTSKASPAPDLKKFEPVTDAPPSGREALLFDMNEGHRVAMTDAIFWNHTNHQVGTVVDAKKLKASISVRGGQSSLEALAAIVNGSGEFLDYKVPEGCQADGDIKDACYLQAVFRDVASDGSPRLLLAVGDGLANLTVNVFEYQVHAPEGKHWRASGAYDGQTLAELDGTTLNLPYGGQGLFEAHDLRQGANAGASSSEQPQVSQNAASDAPAGGSTSAQAHQWVQVGEAPNQRAIYIDIDSFAAGGESNSVIGIAMTRPFSGIETPQNKQRKYYVTTRAQSCHQGSGLMLYAYGNFDNEPILNTAFPQNMPFAKAVVSSQDMVHPTTTAALEFNMLCAYLNNGRKGVDAFLSKQLAKQAAR